MDTATVKDIEINHAKFKAAREERGLSQADVARALGVDRRVIWNYENRCSIPPESFAKLVVFYGKPIEFFLK